MTGFCSDVSALGRSWELRDEEPSTRSVYALRDGTRVPPDVCEIAARRGVVDVAAWLEPSLRAFMPNPSDLVGMDAAAARFCDAVEGGETVAVLGDYDVDGATSTSTLLRWLRLAGAPEPTFHIPDRMTEGYGPNNGAIDMLRARGATLLVIADSGTQAFDQVAHARSIGFDVVILDHHEPKEDGSLPDAVVVNPKRLDCDQSLSYLCTAGLAFFFLVAANRRLRESGYFVRTGIPEPRLVELLGLTALGTVADVVPLKGLNRAFVALGLDCMPLIPGLLALKTAINLGREGTGREVDWTAHGCGFNFGPCINAGGRISDTKLGTRLLTSEDPDECEAISQRLVELNKERQELQKEMVAQCVERVAAEDTDWPVIVVYDESWHPGVVGLGASKVKDEFDRSAVVIGEGGKGSGRSVDGFNIGRAFLRAAAAGLIIKGGGHSAAGGLTIDPTRISELRAFLAEEAKDIQRPATRVDLLRRVGEISVESVEAFEMCAPFGMGNPRPRIAITGGVLDGVRILKDKHVKARLRLGRNVVDIIMFNAVGTRLGEALRAAEGRWVDCLGEISLNEYLGRVTLQVKPDDIMVGAAVSAAAEEAERAA